MCEYTGGGSSSLSCKGFGGSTERFSEGGRRKGFIAGFIGEKTIDNGK